MNSFKKVTRSITFILQALIVACVVPYLLAKPLELFGILRLIDSTYDNLWLFWTLTVISRAAYGALWVFLAYWLIQKGFRYGWFYRKPERKYHSLDEESEDYSMLIFFGIIGVLAVLCYAEIAIRLYTLSKPPFMP